MRSVFHCLFAVMVTFSADDQIQRNKAGLAISTGSRGEGSGDAIHFDSFLLLQDDPCEGAKPGMGKTTHFTKTDVYRAAVVAIQEKAVTDPVHEHIVAFGKDVYGNIMPSAISTGGRTSGNVPVVLNAFADLHNHPRNTPPSSGDLYGLIQKNIRDNSYDTRFVLTPEGKVYALFVTDTAAARAFAVKFPPQQMPGYSPLFPDTLLQEVRDIRYLYGATEEMAMAFVLEKYNAGVSLLKPGSDGAFKKLRTLVSGAGSRLVFTASHCP